MEQRLTNLLMLILLQGQISSIFSTPVNENSAVISNSEDIGEIKAYLPACDDNDNVGSLGKAVIIPAKAVESVANTPISALSAELPAIQKEILDGYNKYRSQAVPGAGNKEKMVWSSEAAKTAEDSAKQCKVGHSPKASRAITDSICKETELRSNVMVPWNTVIDSWQREYADCKNGKNGLGALSDAEVGHSIKVSVPIYHMGCSLARCPKDKFNYLYVCHVCAGRNQGSGSLP
ncbi:cysteine-rich venom protein TRI1-like [Dendrobates tinctorius]|uniref:cysteine-rich venom protein TRI1-like n=1 Tax=Dendrobates tinctorius TaxID=92724 RepID=UPI003CC9CCB3